MACAHSCELCIGVDQSHLALTATTLLDLPIYFGPESGQTVVKISAAQHLCMAAARDDVFSRLPVKGLQILKPSLLSYCVACSMTCQVARRLGQRFGLRDLMLEAHPSELHAASPDRIPAPEQHRLTYPVDDRENAATQSFATAINSATVTSSAVAILKRCITPRFCPPRSTELIYERSMPARWASSSWDRSCLSRTSRIALPS